MYSRLTKIANDRNSLAQQTWLVALLLLISQGMVVIVMVYTIWFFSVAQYHEVKSTGWGFTTYDWMLDDENFCVKIRFYNVIARVYLTCNVCFGMSAFISTIQLVCVWYTSWSRFWAKNRRKIEEKKAVSDRLARKEEQLKCAAAIMKSLRQKLSRYERSDEESKLLTRIIMDFLTYDDFVLQADKVQQLMKTKWWYFCICCRWKNTEMKPLLGFDADSSQELSDANFFYEQMDIHSPLLPADASDFYLDADVYLDANDFYSHADF